MGRRIIISTHNQAARLLVKGYRLYSNAEIARISCFYKREYLQLHSRLDGNYFDQPANECRRVSRSKPYIHSGRGAPQWQFTRSVGIDLAATVVRLSICVVGRSKAVPLHPSAMNQCSRRPPNVPFVSGQGVPVADRVLHVHRPHQVPAAATAPVRQPRVPIRGVAEHQRLVDHRNGAGGTTPVKVETMTGDGCAAPHNETRMACALPPAGRRDLFRRQHVRQNTMAVAWTH